MRLPAPLLQAVVLVGLLEPAHDLLARADKGDAVDARHGGLLNQLARDLRLELVSDVGLHLVFGAPAHVVDRLSVVGLRVALYGLATLPSSVQRCSIKQRSRKHQ